MSVNFSASLSGFYSFMVSALNEVKTSYSPEQFKTLLLKKYPFPANIIVTGGLNLSGCRGLAALPEGLTVKSNLYIFHCTGLKELPKALNVGGNLELSL